VNVKAIIFDFDGVLANSFQYLYALNKMAMAESGIVLSESQYKNFFNDNVHAAFKDFIKDNNTYKKFSEIRQQNFDKYYLLVKLFSELAEFLNKVKEKYILTIASSGKQERVMDLLAADNLDQYFQIIIANSDHSKEQMINEIMKKLRLFPADLAFISDTCGDLILAKKLGLKAIGVGWGFQSLAKLKSIGPDFIA